jgi:hypothetical protein
MRSVRVYSLFHYKFAVSVSGVMYTHHQEYRKLVVDHRYKSNCKVSGLQIVKM